MYVQKLGLLERSDGTVKEIELREVPRIPEQFNWVLVLKRIKEKGYVLKFHYNVRGEKKVSNNLLVWSCSPTEGVAPVMPDKVEVFEKRLETISIDGFEQAKRTRVKLRKVAEIHDIEGLDPSPEETMTLWNEIYD